MTRSVVLTQGSGVVPPRVHPSMIQWLGHLLRMVHSRFCYCMCALGWQLTHNAHLPQQVAKVLCASHPMPMRKKDAGVRPILVGEVLQHLTSNVACQSALPTFCQQTEPLQMRCRTSNAVELVTGRFNSCWRP
jgi:hypothetical protein